MQVMLIDADYNFGLALKVALDAFGVKLTHYTDTSEGLKVWKTQKDPYELLLISENITEYDLDIALDEIRDNDVNLPILVITNGNDLQSLKVLLERRVINSVGYRSLDANAVQDLIEQIYKLIAQFKGS